MLVRFKWVLAAASVLMLATTAKATPNMDINGDDEISRIEYMSFRSNAFNKDDKNFDGKLTKEEIQAARTERNRQNVKKRFKGMDTNGDGGITQSEFEDASGLSTQTQREKRTVALDKWFDDMDTDNNGNISRLEYNGFLNKQMESVEKSSASASLKRFQRLDLDGDGTITESEYVDKGRNPTANKSDRLKGLYAHETAKPKKRTRRDGNSDGDITKREDREYNEYQFDKMDKNKDGTITKKENRFIFGDFKNSAQRLHRD